ncbi:hypothetical protein D043_1439B, partial [Vibrio parahaemolyticus EKP-021]
FIVQ